MGNRNKRDRPKPDLFIPQALADYLITAPKRVVGGPSVICFVPGMDEELRLVEVGGKEEFRLIVCRSEFDPKHAKYEILARRNTVLVRLEYEGPPHRNPPPLRELIDGNHIHEYKEGYGDRWARRIGEEFGDPDDVFACLLGFLDHCKIVQMPRLERVRRLF